LIPPTSSRIRDLLYRRSKVTASDGSFESDVDGLPLARICSPTIEALARRKLDGGSLSDAEMIAICTAVVEDIDGSKAALRTLIDRLSNP
jgi:hypothetical protein